MNIGDWKQAGKEININELIYRILYLLNSEIANFFIFRTKIVLQKKIPFSPGNSYKQMQENGEAPRAIDTRDGKESV